MYVTLVSLLLITCSTTASASRIEMEKTASSVEHAAFAKTFSIHDIPHLYGLDVGSLLTAYVTYDPDMSGDAAAKLRFSSDSAMLLDAFTVTSVSDERPSVRVSEKPQSELRKLADDRGEVRGRLLLEVFLRDPHYLVDVGASGDASIYIDRDVIGTKGTAKSVYLHSSGSGDLLVRESDPIELKELDVVVSGNGDVQLEAPDLIVERALRLDTSGSGDVSVFAEKMSVSTLRIQSSGAADTVVQSQDLSTEELDVKVSGSSEVTLLTSGRCAHESIRASGTGDIKTQAIECESANVAVGGTASVSVQVSGTLEVSISGMSDIYYEKQTPATIIDHSSKSLFGSSSVQYKEYSGVDMVSPKPWPEKDARYVNVHVGRSRMWRVPSISTQAKDGDDSGFSVAIHSYALGFVAVAAACVLLVNMFMSGRTRSEEHQTLIA